jgi:hypothetical protein
LGVTDFSFLLCLKLIFFIIFILLNIVLLYIEYLDRKYNNKYYPDSHLKAGLSPELQKIAKQVIVGVGILSGAITIKNEYVNQDKASTLRAEARELLQNSEETVRRTTSKNFADNFCHRMQITNIRNSIAEVEILEKEESEIKKQIKENNVQ